MSTPEASGTHIIFQNSPAAQQILLKTYLKCEGASELKSWYLLKELLELFFNNWRPPAVARPPSIW